MYQSAWVGVGSLAIVIAMLIIFPGSDAAAMLLRLVGVWVVAQAVYRLTCPQSRGAQIAILVFTTLLACGVILNLWYFTTASGGTDTAPVLINDDSATAWYEMQLALSGLPRTDVARAGLGVFLSWLSWGGIPQISALLCMTMLAALLAIVLTGATAAAMQPVESFRARTCTWAMILMGSVTYFLVSGTILLKDAWMVLAIAMTVYAVFGCRSAWSRYILMVAAFGLMYAIRGAQLAYVAVLLAIAIPVLPRSRRTGTAILAAVASGLYILTLYIGTQHIILDIADDTLNFNIHEGPSERLAAYSAIAGDYPNLSTLQRLLRLPFSLAVQYLTPLPWAFGRDTIFGPTQALSHFSLPWYAIGGILLYCLFFCMRALPRSTSGMLIFGALAMAATAYVTGGTVSRYCLPWLPAMIPAAAMFMTDRMWRRRSFVVWYPTYGVLLVAALIVCITTLNASTGGAGWSAA